MKIFKSNQERIRFPIYNLYFTMVLLNKQENRFGLWLALDDNPQRYATTDRFAEENDIDISNFYTCLEVLAAFRFLEVYRGGYRLTYYCLHYRAWFAVLIFRFFICSMVVPVLVTIAANWYIHRMLL